MKSKIKKSLFWVLAVFITLGTSVYQRMTGPTYPVDVMVEHQNVRYDFELPRSHGGETDCPVVLELPMQFEGELVYRRFPVDEKWDTLMLGRVDEWLVVDLPHQPPAGKLEYHLNLNYLGEPVETNLEENVVVRFKGEVPAWALIPHIFFMFFAMLWSNATGIQAVANIQAYKRNAVITLILLVVGGLILGPIVQKYAFGAYWTGWPFGEDLTDNKVLLSVVVWVAAIMLNKRKDRRWAALVAALVLLAIYMIPHSMKGSELDYDSGEVITGTIWWLALMKIHIEKSNS